MSIRSSRVGAALLLLLCLNGPLPAQLRVQPAGELPADASLRLMLRKLSTVGTFMETTAHPDDEDNALLAMMSHGEGMRSVLVTATRGDGGQNEIGPEIFQALGVLRTEELLAVHRFDGAEQYFTRAIDFGYSFSLEESIHKWGREAIVGDFVRHIRATRPDVIAGFICGGDGGGQHHQASTRLTAEAFRAAADASRYPEQMREGLQPWQAKRLFCLQGFSFERQPAAASRDLLRVSPGGFDPLLGRTYNELGLEARSMHKCQGTSQLLLLPGQSPTRTYQLTDAVVGEPGIAPPRMFDGIDTTLDGLGAYAGPSPPPTLTASLQAIGAAVTAATAAVTAGGPAAAAPSLAAGLAAVRDLRAKLPALGLSDAARYEIEFRLARKEPQFQEALLLTHGIRLEALADDGTVVVGQRLKISAIAGNNGPDVTLKSVSFAGVARSPAGIVSGPVGQVVNSPIPGAGAVTSSVDVWVGRAPLSSPYWTPRTDAARYDFEPDVPFGVPFRPTPFRATFALTIAGADVTVERPVEYRYSDLFAGEKRMELQVVPPFAVRVSPDIAVVPGGAVTATASPGTGSRTRNVAVTVANNQQVAMAASLSLSVPAGWQSTPASTKIAFERQDEEVTVTFAVTPGGSVKPGDYFVEATAATVTGPAATSTVGYEVVEYPHIHRRHVVQPARARVKVIDVTIAPGLRVGYIMGVGDEMPTAIEQLGAEVHLIEAAGLASGDLSRYDVIVTGVRAYERRADLRANNHRLLSYVENGGTVLVNYNKQEFNQAPYGPYPVKVGTDRVTDENAPVEVLAPAHPVFNTPNRIGPETWAGWVQERGTYFLGERDPRYVDLIRTTDPFPLNAGPKSGALVEARSGTGRWIYIGLGLWRQLPAGTDGAYRLLANLLSLGRR